jgi:uncharacterized protein DUF2845
MTRLGPLLAVALAALAAPLAARADGLRCDGGLVSLGDSKLDLLAKCGSPALAERRPDHVALLDRSAGLERRVVAPAEAWTYDFGPSRLVAIVTIVRGRVAAVEHGGYGYAAGPPADRPRKAACEPAVLSTGRTKYEVLARCGEPASIDAWDEEVRVARAVDGRAADAVLVRTVEIWTYDFGPSYLVRYVRFDGGEITRVASGSWGYGE